MSILSRFLITFALLLLYPTTALAQAQLSLRDFFLPFAPGGAFAYDRDGGERTQVNSFMNFGAAAAAAIPNMELPKGETPDIKMRVEVTLSDDVVAQWPVGDILVEGYVYEPEPTGGSTPIKTPVSETLEFTAEGTKRTTLFFDEVDLISTTGLGVATTLEVAFWDGHEQEGNASIGITGVTSATECTDDYRVYFNGQEARPDWDSDDSTCTAALLVGRRLVNGQEIFNTAYRGLYFPLSTKHADEDAFWHFDETLGHVPTVRTFEDWVADLPYRGYFFDVTTESDVYLRPIVVQLKRQSDYQIVDSQRVMLTVSRSTQGDPSLVEMGAEAETLGAIAQLSPRGIGRLSGTHATTLPYPIVPAGTQPRLSESAITLPSRSAGAVEVDFEDLTVSDLAYWTAPSPTGTEFAGYVAYLDANDNAQGQYLTYVATREACKFAPVPQACETQVDATFCVDHRPTTDDFRIRIDGIDTFFDPARPTDALTVGDVTNLDLSFGTNRILSDFVLQDIQGWLGASIDPADIYVEWKHAPFDPCIIEPAPRQLSDFVSGTDDRDHWLVCTDLSFSAASGVLGAPVEFDVLANGEQIDTPFAPGVPDVVLFGPESDPGVGVCDRDWLAPTIYSALLTWQQDVEDTIAAELTTSPGEDEALNRLLAPYELGVPRIVAPRPGTPPYDVQPLIVYDLMARIEAAPDDTIDLGTSPAHGLYVPYVTKSTPIGGEPFFVWFCHRGGGQTCGAEADLHLPRFDNGRDPDGDIFDVSVHFRTAHINQALWAQARRADHLGSPGARVQLDVPEDALLLRASQFGYSDVVAALTAIGSRFRIRYHQAAAPFTTVPDGGIDGHTPLLYVVPNLIVELVAVAADDTETVVAEILVDVTDRDHRITFSTGGVRPLDVSWGAKRIHSVTTTYLDGCYESRNAESCDDHLRSTIGDLAAPAIEATLLTMIANAPTLQRFDSGQESPWPRKLKNPRTFQRDERLTLVGDLCVPSHPSCP